MTVMVAFITVWKTLLFALPIHNGIYFYLPQPPGRHPLCQLWFCYFFNIKDQYKFGFHFWFFIDDPWQWQMTPALSQLPEMFLRADWQHQLLAQRISGQHWCAIRIRILSTANGRSSTSSENKAFKSKTVWFLRSSHLNSLWNSPCVSVIGTSKNSE